MQTVNPPVSSLDKLKDNSPEQRQCTSLRINGERSLTVKFFTLGCKVNQYETQAIREQFISAGFTEVGSESCADIYVVNTCTVTGSADRQSLYLVRKAFKENPKSRIIVTGCYAEAEVSDLKDTGLASCIVKNEEKSRILSFLESKKPLIGTGRFGISHFKDHSRAFIKIQDGCNNGCSYCRIPQVRGRAHSRALADIKQEAVRLVENGYKEIVLCGICLGAYGQDFKANIPDLADVLDALEKLEGLFRIRLSSIEAWDISGGLIDKLTHSGKVCPHLHIPIQSGDDEILKMMNRRISKSDYIKLARRLKQSVPNLAITTDVIVGFPGEREKNFHNTVDLIREIEPLRVHIFPFSPRPGTAAFNFKERVSAPDAAKRIAEMKDVAGECSLKYKAGFLNRTLRVLVEGYSQKEGYLAGYSDNYIKILFKGEPHLASNLVEVKLSLIKQESIIGEFVG